MIELQIVFVPKPLVMGKYQFVTLPEQVCHFECKRCGKCESVFKPGCEHLEGTNCRIQETKPAACRVFPFFIAWNQSTEDKRIVIHWQDCPGVSAGENNINKFMPALDEIWEEIRRGST